MLNILTQISLVYLALIGTDPVLSQENLGDLVTFTQGYAAPGHIAARASRLEASASPSLAADAGSDQGAPSSGHVTQADIDRGTEIIREDTRRLQEDTRRSLERRRQLETEIAEMEKKSERREAENERCYKLVDSNIDNYIKNYAREEAKARSRQLIEQFKQFIDYPGLPCPVSEGLPR